MNLTAYSQRCSGCKACLLVCALENFGLNNPKYGALNIIQHFPDPGTFEVKVCTRCGTCKDVCPTGAIEMGDNGFFRVNSEECIGCRACVEACPEKVIRFIVEKNVAFTCTGCGECVRYCPREAVTDASGEVARV